MSKHFENAMEQDVTRIRIEIESVTEMTPANKSRLVLLNKELIALMANFHGERKAVNVKVLKS